MDCDRKGRREGGMLYQLWFSAHAAVASVNDYTLNKSRTMRFACVVQGVGRAPSAPPDIDPATAYF